jgi:hypothetical protein
MEAETPQIRSSGDNKKNCDRKNSWVSSRCINIGMNKKSLS